jgi:hypothetical protein
MMNPQKQITTNAPSIRYEGDLRAEQAGIMQKHAQAMQQMQQQNMMQQQQATGYDATTNGTTTNATRSETDGSVRWYHGC